MPSWQASANAEQSLGTATQVPAWQTLEEHGSRVPLEQDVPSGFRSRPTQVPVAGSQLPAVWH